MHCKSHPWIMDPGRPAESCASVAGLARTRLLHPAMLSRYSHGSSRAAATPRGTMAAEVIAIAGAWRAARHVALITDAANSRSSRDLRRALALTHQTTGDSIPLAQSRV